MSLATRPVWHQISEIIHQLIRNGASKLPSWTTAALIAFGLGWTGAVIWAHSTRRRWRASQLRIERAVPTLKGICVSCWNELDPEQSGWMDPNNARVCLARILETAQLQTAQLAQLIAPQLDAQANSDSSASSSSSSPHQAEIESELRLILQKLLTDISRRETLEAEFPFFLETLEARPAQLPHSFTPPINGTSRKHSHSPRLPMSSVASTVSSGSSPPRSHAGGASSSPPLTDDEHKSSSLHPAIRAASRSAVDALDRKIFRYEFSTAAVGWLELHIIRRMFNLEQTGQAQ